jgi:hypothetical protein
MDRMTTNCALLTAVMALILVAGCSPSERSLSRGELVSVDLLDGPYPQYSPHEYSTDKHTGGEVEIYENFIVVTSSEGVSVVAPHGWYKNLVYKKK